MLSLAAHELRQQLGSHVFRVVFAVSLLMVAGAQGIDALRVGLDGVSEGPDAVARVHLIWTLFYLFTAAAFAGDAVLRDELTGMAPIVRATPVAPGDYLFGRFIGAFGATVACFLSVPLALALGGLVRGEGVDVGALAFGFLVLAVPNLFLACALFFGLATVARSMSACLLGAVGLLVVYGVYRDGVEVPVLLEPFGFAAVAAGEGVWLNRVVWVGVGLCCLALAFVAHQCRPAGSAPLPGGERATRREPSGVRGLDASRDKHRAPSPGRAQRVSTAGSASRVEHAPGMFQGRPGDDPTRLSGPAPRRGEVVVAQVASRTAHETRQLLRSPAFAILLLLGLASAVARLWTPAQSGAGTHTLIRNLIESFQLVPVTVSLFFAGELFWAEREKGMGAIVAATPASSAVLFLPKCAALALVLLGLALATGLTGMALEAIAGRAPDPVAWTTLYMLPKWRDWLIFAALAMLLQSVAPSKLAGWGFLVLYLIATLGWLQAGLDPRLLWGGYPGAALPPGLSGRDDAWPWLLGWSLAALGAVALGSVAAARRRHHQVA